MSKRVKHSKIKNTRFFSSLSRQITQDIISDDKKVNLSIEKIFQ